MFRAKSHETETFEKVFADAAVKYKGQGIQFVNVAPTGKTNTKFMEAIGVKATDLPVIRVFDSLKKQKYKYEGNVKDLTTEALDQFIADFKANKVESYLKSEDIPANEGPLKVLVGKNF